MLFTYLFKFQIHFNNNSRENIDLEDFIVMLISNNNKKLLHNLILPLNLPYNNKPNHFEQNSTLDQLIWLTIWLLFINYLNLLNYTNLNLPVHIHFLNKQKTLKNLIQDFYFFIHQDHEYYIYLACYKHWNDHILFLFRIIIMLIN